MTISEVENGTPLAQYFILAHTDRGKLFLSLSFCETHHATEKQTRCLVRNARSWMPRLQKETWHFFMLHFDLDMEAGHPTAFCTRSPTAVYSWYSR